MHKRANSHRQASTCFQLKMENCNCKRTMKRVGSRIGIWPRDPLALSLAKLYLVRAFRFCYFNYLNRQTRQVCRPQAAVNYFLWIHSFWPKRAEIETNRFTMHECKTDLHTAQRKVSFRIGVLLFCCSTFLFSWASRLTFPQILWLVAAASGIFLLFYAPFITWWSVQRLLLVFLLLQQQQP